MCQGITTKGKKCKLKQEPYCRHHQPVVATTAVATTTGIILKKKTKEFLIPKGTSLVLQGVPKAALTFPLDVSHLTNKIRNRIAKYMKDGPTKKDGPGHIYVYYCPQDNPEDTYYKIGRTERSVDARLKEWKKKDGAVLKKSWKVSHQKFIEKLIHAYLDAVRVYRYSVSHTITTGGNGVNNVYCTIWKSTGEPVDLMDAHLKATNKLEARTKHIEWFKSTWKELKGTLKTLVKL